MLPLPEGPETADAKQLMVDWVRCEGHGLCAHLVPELIHLDKTGFPVILPIPVPPWLEKDAQQAVQMCPALALRLDSDPKKRGKGGPKTPPIPVAAPTARSGLLRAAATVHHRRSRAPSAMRIPPTPPGRQGIRHHRLPGVRSAARRVARACGHRESVPGPCRVRRTPRGARARPLGRAGTK